jgi:hypothetical protein
MDPLAATMPMSARSSRTMGFGGTGASVITGLDLTLPLSARRGVASSQAIVPASKSPDLISAEAQFFAPDGTEKERVYNARHNYPSRKSHTTLGSADPLLFNGLEEEEVVPRRLMGFGLGFEKIFATTSIKLPVSAYTIFVELHLAYKDEIFSRCFNGLHTVFDLKKWIFEKLLIPMNAYDLSYAEPGKAMLTEQLRLLTTQDSLDTRTLATTRAVQRMYKGIPGVHSINDVGVTRLYVRLKCRLSGELLNSLTPSRYKKFGDTAPLHEQDFVVPAASPRSKEGRVRKMERDKDKNEKNRDTLRRMTLSQGPGSGDGDGHKGIPGLDPTLEDCWYEPEWKKGCLFHTRGLELWEASRAHGGHSEIARIYISCGKEPSKKLKVATNVLKNKGPCAKTSY